MTGILTIRQIRPRARLAASFAGLIAGFLIAAGPAFPILADTAPRDALPSSEAIGWLLETEPTGSAAPWKNSRSGYSGSVTLTQTWHRADGTPCREYTVTAVAGGTPTMVKGTGCRIGTGAWNLSEDAPAEMAAVAAVRPSPPGRKPAPPAAEPPADPANAVTLLPSAPTARPLPNEPLPVEPPTLPVAADDAPDHTVDSASTHSTAAVAGHKPLAISANLPLRSDE